MNRPQEQITYVTLRQANAYCPDIESRPTSSLEVFCHSTPVYNDGTFCIAGAECHSHIVYYSDPATVLGQSASTRRDQNRLLPGFAVD